MEGTKKCQFCGIKCFQLTAAVVVVEDMAEEAGVEEAVGVKKNNPLTKFYIISISIA